jgi:hypothetical protein
MAYHIKQQGIGIGSKMTRKKKDSVYDPTARVFLTGIGNEFESTSNPGSLCRELEVSIDKIDNPQTGHSYIDVKMENYDQVGWPNITTILQQGHTLTCKGVLRKKYPSGDVYLDVDKIDDLEIIENTPTPNPLKSTNNNFTELFNPEDPDNIKD